MNNIFVSYETAKKLKSYGFDEDCVAAYKTTLGYNENELILFNRPVCYNKNNHICIPEEFYVDAPTIDQALEWTFSKLNLDANIWLNIHTDGSGRWYQTSDDIDNRKVEKPFSNKEEAINIGLSLLLPF